MKKFTFFFAVFFCAVFIGTFAIAQVGYIYTVAGNGTSGFSGDGGQARAAELNTPTDVCEDHEGNFYIVDQGNNRIRKVNSITGIITTIAGNGSSGYSGDGGAATAASLNTPNGVVADGFGNLYIADQGNNVIRKVNTAGIISTIAGIGSSGFTGDGGPATAAQLAAPTSVAIDGWDNLYIADNGNDRIREVDTTGTITTIAGGASSGYGFSTGGVPAISVALNNIHHVSVDINENVYFTNDIWEFLKITPAGLIYLEDSAYVPWGVSSDIGCNVYMATQDNTILRKNAATGLVDTIVRGGSTASASFSGDGGPALTAGLADPNGIYSDVIGNLYIADQTNNRIRFITNTLTGTYNADSFSIFINELCAGPELTIATNKYVPTYNQTTYFGDLSNYSSPVTMGYGGSSGYTNFNHIYAFPGTYSIKSILKNGSTGIDSLLYSYEYKPCVAMPVKFYFDLNGNCIKDSNEAYNSQPVRVQVDSNGVPVDTLSCTSGFYYIANGNPGDIYAFRVLTNSGGFTMTCPSSGVIYDTMVSGINNLYEKTAGLQCGSSGFDLAVGDVIPVTGVHDEWGNIYVSNHSCLPENATVTLHYSKKYDVEEGGGGLDVSPTPASYTDSTITWHVSALDATSGTVDLYYAIWTDLAGGYLTPGLVVQSYVTVTPRAGDDDTSNNSEFVIDTVKAGCDPNEMWVSPQCIYSAISTPVQYTINFVNTGNDTAHNIYVLDTLPANVDISTMNIVMASNEMFISQIKDSIGQNILKFDFPGINLLDSSHHGKCSGAVIFSINTTQGIPYGGTVDNRAGIYFDINGVVMTNTAEASTACWPEKVQAITANNNISITPNPATNELNVNTGSGIYQSYTITNNLGSVVLTSGLTAPITQINIKQLPADVYYIKLMGDSGVEVRKFVKE